MPHHSGRTDGAATGHRGQDARPLTLSLEYIQDARAKH